MAYGSFETCDGLTIRGCTQGCLMIGGCLDGGFGTYNGDDLGGSLTVAKQPLRLILWFQ